jgi:hypothetical protein
MRGRRRPSRKQRKQSRSPFLAPNAILRPVDKPPSVNAQLADSAIVHGTNVQRVGKKISNDVLGMLGQLRDELTAKLASKSVMTQWQRQRATELLQFAKDQIGGTYAEIGQKTAAQLEGLGAVEIHKLSTTVDRAVGVERSLFCAMPEVFLHLLDDLLFVERGADKRVNPIELFRWQLSKRNTQVIGYCPLGRQRIRVGEFLEGIWVRKHSCGHFYVTDKQCCMGIGFQCSPRQS